VGKHISILEGSRRGKGRPGTSWIDSIKEWTKMDSHEKLRRAAKDRSRWKSIIVNVLSEHNTR